MDLSVIESDIERVIVSEVDLQARIKELAAQVDADYEGRDVLLVGEHHERRQAASGFERGRPAPDRFAK